VDLTTTQLQAKGAVPLASHEGGQGEVAAIKPPNVPSLPSANGADRLYLQLAEIHAIAATQLAKCTHRGRSNPTPNMAYAGAGWRGPTVDPSAARMVPLPPTDFSPQSFLGQQG
jgi:hypothetical protein